MKENIDEFEGGNKNDELDQVYSPDDEVSYEMMQNADYI